MGRFSLVFWLARLPLLSSDVNAGAAPDASESTAAEVQPTGIDGGSGVSEAGAQIAPELVKPPAVVVASPAPSPSPSPSPASPPAGPRALPDAYRRSGPAGPCVASETASYRVSFGFLGQVAEAKLRLAPEPASPSAGKGAFPLLVRAIGEGSGDVLGFGKTDKRIESEFDARSLGSRRWTNVRSGNGKLTTDTGEQGRPGTVSLLRKRTGEADMAENFSRAAPVLDPLGFLLSLRVALPQAPAVYEVLDGRALWLAAVSAARLDPSTPGLMRVDGKFDPVYWSGNPDQQRSSYSFSLFFTRDRFHTPVRLVVPFGLGEVRAELVQVERAAPLAQKAASGGFDCREPPRRRFWKGLTDRWTAGKSASSRRAAAGR